MKTKAAAPIKGFKAVEFMREVRNKINQDIKDMSVEEVVRYFEGGEKTHTEKSGEVRKVLQ